MNNWSIHMDLTEFELDKRIDPEQLDVECVNQPTLFFKYAERAIEARGVAERLELALEVVRAETELRIRKRPEKYGLEKPTEAAVKAVLVTHPKVVEANEAWFNARTNAALLDKATVAMEIKKRMLESLITLHGQQYFAGPSAPRDLKAAWMSQQDHASKRLVDRQKIAIKKKRDKT